MYDPENIPESGEYKCINCGNIIESKRHPGNCPKCGEVMQNMGMPLE